ncbi:MAG: pantetheine-phosphate adenylyltransferase [Gammaproteobacteria bacterium]|nr:pantetheine-phosphate adenylyltransferase [Gammaproteobacteria bacterium]
MNKHITDTTAESSTSRTLVYPGSFDPITFGHIDLLHRAVRLFDDVILAVAAGNPKPNMSAKKTMFSLSERLHLVGQVLAEEGLADKVKVEGFDNLLVDFMRDQKARFLLRGLRTVTDFEFEFQLASANRLMYPQIETVFLMPDEGFAYISSSLVREIAFLKGDVSKFVPKTIATALQAKITDKK